MIVVLDLLYYKDGTNLEILLDDKDGARLRTLLCGINCLNATIDGVRLGTLLG